MKMGLGGDLDTNWLSKRKRRGKRGQDRGQRWMSGEVGGVKGGWWCNMSSGGGEGGGGVVVHPIRHAYTEQGRRTWLSLSQAAIDSARTTQKSRVCEGVQTLISTMVKFTALANTAIDVFSGHCSENISFRSNWFFIFQLLWCQLCKPNVGHSLTKVLFVCVGGALSVLLVGRRVALTGPNLLPRKPKISHFVTVTWKIATTSPSKQCGFCNYLLD